MKLMAAANEVAWRVLGKVGKTPAGRVIRPLYKGMTPLGRFVASASSVDELAVDARGATGVRLTAEAGAILSRHGIVVIRNLLAPADVAAARRDAVALKAKVAPLFASGAGFGETDAFAWQKGRTRYRTFRALADAPKPVCYLRSADDDVYDVGMFEVFNIDRLARDLPMPGFASLLGDPSMDVAEAILSRCHRWDRTITNLYQNDAVTAPRGLHIDCLAPSYKTFVYLSDCLSLGEGPYRFVPGSHARRDLLVAGGFVNAARGGTETDFPELGAFSLPMLGEAGTVIISAQFGIHGGQPQSPSGSRSMLVRNYARG